MLPEDDFGRRPLKSEPRCPFCDQPIKKKARIRFIGTDKYKGGIVIIDNDVITLSHAEFVILQTLWQGKSRAISVSHLKQQLYDTEADWCSDNCIKVMVSHLREKLQGTALFIPYRKPSGRKGGQTPYTIKLID